MYLKPKFVLMPLLAFAMGTAALADVTLPAIIDNQMVLQSGTHAPIWGWADPGEVVSVSFAGQLKQAAAAANGKWMVKLDPLSVSSESRTMTIKGNNVIELEDVLVGEVWLASGQSNMEFSIGAIPAEEKAVAAAQVDNRLLRMFCLAPKVSSSLPLNDVAGYWSDCSYFIRQMRARKIKVFDSHSAVAFFFGLKLQQALQVPVAVIDSSWGGTDIESWIADEGYEMEGLALRKMTAKNEARAVLDKESLELAVAAWNEDARAAVENGDYPKPNLKAPRSRAPNAIYNGMIAPLVPFSIKGVVWYQGESNRASRDYFEKLKALIGGWSQVFNVPDLPFYLVQMAPYNYAHGKEKHLSEQIIYDNVVSAQYKAAQEIKSCDVITIPDTVFGEVANVHPPHKKTAGDRLAALALHHVYGQSVICSGPRFAKAIAENGDVIVSFDRIDQGLETSDGEAPNWFEVAGADQQFVAATAKIEGDAVIVSSPDVVEPKFIRLAWNNIAELNLRDKNGWPAFSFNATVHEQ
jgi:sialate O-acetylesterase